MASEAQKKARNKWNLENMQGRYDRMQLIAPKGKKAEYQAHSAARGESLNSFFNRAAANQMNLDNQEGGGTNEEDN